ncbi:MAG: hypothetical protein QOC98_1887 [Frankiaceae bacterium]|nr:hypothetical protein [Frankiaceae bacterium]
MEIPAAVVAQLHVLSHTDDRGDGFVTGVNELGAELARVVPSLLAVSLTLVRLGYDVVVTAHAPGAESSDVTASLAVPLSAGEPADRLVLQAAEPGAFLLLAHDLAGLVGPGRVPLEIDRHLAASPSASPAASAASFALALADLAIVNQAIGALLDRAVLDPAAALAVLGDRAAAARTTIATVSRHLLADLRLPPADGLRGVCWTG